MHEHPVKAVVGVLSIASAAIAPAIPSFGKTIRFQDV